MEAGAAPNQVGYTLLDLSFLLPLPVSQCFYNLAILFSFPLCFFLIFPHCTFVFVTVTAILSCFFSLLLFPLTHPLSTLLIRHSSVPSLSFCLPQSYAVSPSLSLSVSLSLTLSLSLFLSFSVSLMSLTALKSLTMAILQPHRGCRLSCSISLPVSDVLFVTSAMFLTLFCCDPNNRGIS